MSTLLESVRDVFQSREVAALRKYRAILDRADDPKGTDPAALADVLRDLQIRPEDLAADVTDRRRAAELAAGIPVPEAESAAREALAQRNANRRSEMERCRQVRLDAVATFKRMMVREQELAAEFAPDRAGVERDELAAERRRNELAELRRANPRAFAD